MELTKVDTGKYFLVCDNWETCGIKTVAKFVSDTGGPNIYRYRMFCVKGHWEGKLDTFRKCNVKRRLTDSEALAMIL